MKLKLIGMITAAFAMLPVHASTTHPVSTYRIEHVLMISIDGMHALDMKRFISEHPQSAMAQLARHGIQYTHARTVAPADSFPGLLALLTGGKPAETGVYFDITYDRRLSMPGSDCHDRGTTVTYDESIDALNGGNGKPLLQASLLPRDPDGCVPVFPHAYLRTNTVFEVIQKAHGHTAWIDKHPVYEIVNGPSGHGVDDLWTPEIGGDYEGTAKSENITGSLAKTERYDEMKVDGLIHEIDGFRHDGKDRAPVPTLFGLNLQSVNVGQKRGGYLDAAGRPSDQLEGALNHCDVLLQKIVSELTSRGLLDSTLLIVTAKHGNGPIDPQLLRRVDRQQLADTIEKAVPGAMAQLTSDRGAFIWLRDQNKTPAIAAALKSDRHRLGILRVLSGRSLTEYFGSDKHDSRTPDLVVIPEPGVIYVKAGDEKRAEHGGFSKDDTNVALLISNPQLRHSLKIVDSPVLTTQVAPTILKSLGLSPLALDAVAKQKTAVLPGVNWGAHNSN